MAAPPTEESPLPSWGTFDYGGGLKEVAVVKSIEEYLSYHHLRRPLEAFQRDVARVGLKHKPSHACADITQNVEDVLADFNAGRRVGFGEAWERIMPLDFRSGPEGRSLDLRLQAHFATFRARQVLEAGGEPDAAELREDLEPFRAFLGERGLDEVGGDEALMPLFALPFMQRPHAQPHVREVFAGKWLSELRRDVEAALRARQPKIPLLYSLLEPTPEGPSGETAAWQTVWAELYRVADSALDAATMLAHGMTISAEQLAKGRQQLEHLREQVPGGLEIKLKSLLADPTSGFMSPSRSVRSRAATAQPQMPRDIDFGRLAQFICAPLEEHARQGGGDSEGAVVAFTAVLRALLQRLASAESPVSHRRGFLASVACFDVLGVRSRPETLLALLSHPAFAELTLGILAVLACEAVGRTYIVASLACVEKVVELLKVQPLDSSPHIQALAALQRLSLRRAPQDRMIQLGLVEWAVGVLGWQGEAIHGAPSEFSLEFSSAMLMNLALRTVGKRKCVELDTLTVALNLMEHWNPQIRTHINGTLYSLLSVPSFRARARHTGLDGVLRSIYSQAASLGDEVSRRQIEYLLEQLNPKGSADDEEGGTASGEDDEDDDENFLEEEELAGLLLGDRCGQSAEEALRRFSSTQTVAEAQHREFRSFVGRGYPRAAR